MKKFSKILSVALLVALVLSLGISSAFADANAQHTITIRPVAGQKGAHTYTAYQVFAGDYADGKLSNITWGSGVNGSALLSALKDNDKFLIPDTSEGAGVGAKVNAFANCADAADVAEVLGANTTFAEDFADVVGNNLSSTTAGSANAAAADGETTTQTGNAVITVTGDGYYFVKDTTTTLPEGEARTDYILQVLDNVAIDTKSGTTESNKKVDDVNDSTGVEQKKNDSADHDIGDTVSYTLTAKLPADYANYKDYKLVFVDDMSAGLTLNAGSVKIHYGENDEDGTTIQFAEAGTTSYPTTNYPTITKNGTDYTGHVYSYTIADLKTVAAASTLGAGDVITITYTATLNEAAVIGSAGNPNIYRVEYSNNPNGEGEGHTPWDKNIVFTYKTVFNKVDGDKKPLTGADFELFKFVKGATSDGKSETYKGVTGAWVNVTALHDSGANPTKAKETLTNENGTADNAKFTFAGLDDGYYKLVETKTPDGYNTITPIEFTITAEHDLESEDPRLTSLTGTEGQEIIMTPVLDSNEKPTGELVADVENHSGATLPSTGGIGTTIFYAVGGILVLAAIVLLITKKRMSD